MTQRSLIWHRFEVKIRKICYGNVYQEKDVDEDMKEVFRKNKRIEAVTLVNRVLVVRFQFIERNDLKQLNLLEICT